MGALFVANEIMPPALEEPTALVAMAWLAWLVIKYTLDQRRGGVGDVARRVIHDRVTEEARAGVGRLEETNRAILESLRRIAKGVEDLRDRR